MPDPISTSRGVTSSPREPETPPEATGGGVSFALGEGHSRSRCDLHGTDALGSTKGDELNEALF